MIEYMLIIHTETEILYKLALCSNNRKVCVTNMNINDTESKSKGKGKFSVRWTLVVYDLVCILCLDLLLLVLCGELPLSTLLYHGIASAVCIFAARFAFKIYSQIWRYGGIQSYIRLIAADVAGYAVYLVFGVINPNARIPFALLTALCSVNLLGALSMRMLYRYAYKYNNANAFGRVLCKMVYFCTGRHVENKNEMGAQKIKIAIVGAGRVGVSLAEELLNNATAAYVPVCFVDVKSDKVGREIHGIPVLSEEDATFEVIRDMGVQEIVFAVPQLDAAGKKTLYDYYKQSGCKMKVYDFPVMQTAGSTRRALREFDIEELLFRDPITIGNEMTDAYYRNKTILITGGGGSIGSELCRQIAKMGPKKLIILDVYENGAYDVQQELKIAYGENIDLQVEILSVCNRSALERIFAKYRPDIVLNAAAHKHVPLMEHNCCEAVENNVFGTLNTVELSEKYGVGRFIMVSTDKAVNPTNVMGATKRMCEMIVRAHSRMHTPTVYSATRFGNVLGSAGSVIPLFRRQIANGGPITLTDKRIIRYFMTIPEASQLVLESGAMAKNGELFVLDMGKPIKIVELAENMITLSGLTPYRDIDIVEMGLRPGEKLYEELLMESEKLGKTDNNLIFIEKDTPITMDELAEKLEVLRKAVESGNDKAVKKALHKVVPTFRDPEEVNEEAENAKEMAMAEEKTEERLESAQGASEQKNK